MSRISLATLALLAIGSACAYADQPNQDQNSRQAHNAAQQPQGAAQPNAEQNSNQQNAGQSAATQPGQTAAGQQGASQQSTGQQGGAQFQQQPGQRQPYQVNMNPGLQGGAAQAAQRNVDLFLIPCLINANNAEITLGRIAEQRAQSQAVKQFAQEAIKDHTDLLQKTEQLQNKLRGEMRPQNPNATPAAAALFEINQEVEQACLASAQRELEQQQGADFDRCYAGMQVGMHMHVDSALTVFEKHAQSTELKKAIQDAQQVVQHHLDEAKKIVKDLEQQGANNRASTTTTTR